MFVALQPRGFKSSYSFSLPSPPYTDCCPCYSPGLPTPLTAHSYHYFFHPSLLDKKMADLKDPIPSIFSLLLLVNSRSLLQPYTLTTYFHAWLTLLADCSTYASALKMGAVSSSKKGGKLLLKHTTSHSR
jgi:hypothetical protein